MISFSQSLPITAAHNTQSMHSAPLMNSNSLLKSPKLKSNCQPSEADVLQVTSCTGPNVYYKTEQVSRKVRGQEWQTALGAPCHDLLNNCKVMWL